MEAPHYLSPLFEPNSIAVIGASHRPYSVGTKVLKNLLSAGFVGSIYPVNPKYRKCQHLDCYPSVNLIEGVVDLAIIATPANTIPKIIAECGGKGIRHVVILSSGFSETGKEGRALENHILNIAKGYHMQLVGPNCLGLMRPSWHLNATFDNSIALPGHTAFVSQSGALSSCVLDWAASKNIGFSTIVSIGNSIDIDFADILDYLAFDPSTKSILLYIEGIRHSRKFMSALRATARMKPVIAIKAGRHSLGTRAAISHTGALIGDDDVFNAALQRAGVVRVVTIEELFLAAEILTSDVRIKGNRLYIVTNGGGAGVIAADRAVDMNIKLPQPSSSMMEKLNHSLPSHWSHQNPIDIIGDATPERYRNTLSICADEEGCDGILTILVPVPLSQPLKVAEEIVQATKTMHKPMLACWMGDKHVKSSWKLFAKHGIPFFDTPEKAIQAFSYLSDYHRNQQLLLQVPEPICPQAQPDIVLAKSVIDSALLENRSILSAFESKKILEAFGIPVTKTYIATNKVEALQAAEAIGYPVAMKIYSPDITHKQDVGGVALNITNQDALEKTFDQLLSKIQSLLPNAKINGVTIEPMFKNTNDRELLIGVMHDEVFGPVISFGAGGTLVEIMEDRTLALPPLNHFIARQLIDETRIAKMLGKFRNMPAVNIEMIISILLRVSEMVCELPEIKEMDINPLIVNDHAGRVVDARIVIDPSYHSGSRYDHMAIHPYPNNLISSFFVDHGLSVTFRPVRPEDAGMVQDFFSHLSLQSKYFRFMQHIRTLTPEALMRLTQIDYDREMTMVATLTEDAVEACVGVAHYITNPDRESCEFAIAVADHWQQRGIGSRLMNLLCNEAKAQGLITMFGVVLATNSGMLEMTHHLGFETLSHEDPTIKIVKKYL